jgi:two-component system, cell cycle sensor histidine kinase and response regulator CckA
MAGADASPKVIRVLHLEDNAVDADLVRAMLGEDWPGCRITVVHARGDFEAALQAGRFDLVLSDFSLPQFDGFTALARARELSPATPFVFLSGSIGEAKAARAREEGAADFISKEQIFDLNALVRRVLGGVG